ncbi:MAG: hypothetical protein CM15mP34_1810 [Gammaproteobacteria bacterium]|nr:MAG: hypothetical protein CM15mP34_1810 [Gammaproteobacteria bacterium]
MIYSSPRFGMEGVGISIVAIFAYSATLNLGGIDQFLPILELLCLERKSYYLRYKRLMLPIAELKALNIPCRML